MYYERFGLTQAPFKITPDTQLFYAGGERGLVLEALVYAITHGEGIIKVVGEVGSGKTMLCRMLPEKLPERVELVYLANPRLTPDTILQAIAFEMGLPIASDSERMNNRLQVMQAIQEHLIEKHAAACQVVVLVEEAQGMPLDTLEEIRLLSNLETKQDKLLQIVLFGQPELDENLADNSIRQLKERITHSFYLSPLPQDVIGEYLDFRMRAVGYKGPPVFSPAALKRLNAYSEGILRRINILADKALLAAFSENAYQVEPKHIVLAARDSGFLKGSNREKAMPFWWFGLGGVLVAVLVFVTLNYFLGGGNRPAQLPPAPTEPSIEKAPEPRPQPPAAIEEPPETIEKPAEIPIEPLIQQRLEATQTWLAQADDSHYSIQVMLTEISKTDDLENFLKRPELQSLLAKMYVYQSINQAEARVWGVIYGDFPSEEAAHEAMRQLPETLRRNQPFLRTIASIRNKISR